MRSVHPSTTSTFIKKGAHMMPLPPQLLPAVPHIDFSIFDLAVPNIIAWGALVVVFVLALLAPLPRFFEPRDED
jgi:hypothetical protein